MFTNIVERFHIIRKRRFFKHGLPFLLFLLLGSFGVQHFASLRYEFRKNELLTKENLAKLGIEKKTVTLEEEFEKIQELDINSWENIRGPRPWEEPQQQQTQSKQS